MVISFKKNYEVDVSFLVDHLELRIGGKPQCEILLQVLLMVSDNRHLGDAIEKTVVFYALTQPGPGLRCRYSREIIELV